MARNLIGYKRRRDNVTSSTFQGRGGNVVRRKRRCGKRSRPKFNPALRNSVYRWQRSSDSFVGPGAVKLMAWPANAAGNAFKYLPIHFISLTNNHTGVEHSGKGCIREGMQQYYFNSVGNAYGYDHLSCQTNDNMGTSLEWQLEKGEVQIPTELAKYMRHRWTDIKMNLYGTFSLPITYNVYLMQCKQQLDPFNYGQFGGITLGSELYNMLKDWSRDLLGNSVNKNGRIDWPKDVRIIRHDKVTLQPLNYSDQLAELSGPIETNNAHTPNVHEYRLFVNHNRYRDYKWSENATDEQYANDLDKPQWDVNKPVNCMCDVEWGKRLFLVITATHPGPQYGSPSDSFVPTVSDVRLGGSYDICVRNSWDYNW